MRHLAVGSPGSMLKGLDLTYHGEGRGCKVAGEALEREPPAILSNLTLGTGRRLAWTCELVPGNSCDRFFPMFPGNTQEFPGNIPSGVRTGRVGRRGGDRCVSRSPWSSDRFRRSRWPQGVLKALPRASWGHPRPPLASDTKANAPNLGALPEGVSWGLTPATRSEVPSDTIAFL